jgi:hypothetical protein
MQSERYLNSGWSDIASAVPPYTPPPSSTSARRGGLVLVKAVKASVIPLPVRKFNVDRRITMLRQHEVDEQPPGASVAVDKGMNALKLQMKKAAFSMG